jgi:hypothetical protein
MTHSFGEGYSTRSDEEGFGGVYGGNDPVENLGTEKIHPSHPGSCTLCPQSDTWLCNVVLSVDRFAGCVSCAEYDTSQGSEVKEKEKARHLKDDKHAA